MQETINVSPEPSLDIGWARRSTYHRRLSPGSKVQIVDVSSTGVHDPGDMDKFDAGPPWPLAHHLTSTGTRYRLPPPRIGGYSRGACFDYGRNGVVRGNAGSRQDASKLGDRLEFLHLDVDAWLGDRPITRQGSCLVRLDDASGKRERGSGHGGCLFAFVGKFGRCFVKRDRDSDCLSQGGCNTARQVVLMRQQGRFSKDLSRRGHRQQFISSSETAMTQSASLQMMASRQAQQKNVCKRLALR